MSASSSVHFLVIPESTAKESRIKISLWGFTYKLYPDIGWTADIAEFIKAPPGVSYNSSLFA